MSSNNIKENNKGKIEKEMNDNINDFRVWQQKQNLYNDNILDKVLRSQTKIKNFTEALNENEKNDRKKKTKTNQNTDINKDKNQNDNLISDKVKDIMSEVGKTVMKIRKSEEESSKNNIEFLLKTTDQIKRSEIIGEPNNILKAKEKEYKLSLEGKTKKSPNYKFLSDCYRKQINKIFMEYNPMIHLGNIHLLRESDADINEYFNEQSDQIEKQLGIGKYRNNEKNRNPSEFNYNLNDINFNNSKLKNSKSVNKKLVKNFNLNYTSGNFKNKNGKDLMGQTCPTAPTDGMNTIYEGRKNAFSQNKSKIKKNDEKQKKKYPLIAGDNKFRLELIGKAYNRIDAAIDKKNFDNYYRSYEELKNIDIDQQRHIYFGNMEIAKKLMIEVQENLYIKNLNEEIKNKKKKITNESDSLVDKISELKFALIDEIQKEEAKDSKEKEGKTNENKK